MMRSIFTRTVKTLADRLTLAFAVVVGLGAIAGHVALSYPEGAETKTPASIDATTTSALSDEQADIPTRFSICGSGRRDNCVVDGDTFWMNGAKIRIADIDTPELSPPRCAREKSLGEAAKHELLSQLNAGGIEIASAGKRDTDRYGRQLRIVLRDGRSITETMVEKGLARRWEGSRRSWCD